MCDDRSQNDLQTIYMYTQSQKTTGPKQKNEWDQDRSPITGTHHSKSIEEAGMSQSRRYTWRAQPQRHALRYITTSNMFFLKTYILGIIWSEIAIRKGSTASTFSNVDCSTLQTSRPNQPPNHIDKHTETHTNKQQSVHALHACIHSIHHIHSFTVSQERTKHYH